MKQRIKAAVSPGDVLQVHSGKGPIGEAVTVPQGTTSVTIVFRDGDAAKASAAKRAEKRGKPKRARRAGKRAAKASGAQPKSEE
jgi:hypothetical protein